MTYNTGTGKYDDLAGNCGALTASIYRVDNPSVPLPCLTACNGEKCCCDVSANTWTVALDHFSEYAGAGGGGALLPGRRPATAGCRLRGAGGDPPETPPTHPRGLPNPKRTCVDGDPLCDRDGVV